MDKHQNHEKDTNITKNSDITVNITTTKITKTYGDDWKCETFTKTSKLWNNTNIYKKAPKPTKLWKNTAAQTVATCQSHYPPPKAGRTKYNIVYRRNIALCRRRLDARDWDKLVFLKYSLSEQIAKCVIFSSASRRNSSLRHFLHRLPFQSQTLQTGSSCGLLMDLQVTALSPGCTLVTPAATDLRLRGLTLPFPIRSEGPFFWARGLI